MHVVFEGKNVYWEAALARVTATYLFLSSSITRAGRPFPGIKYSDNSCSCSYVSSGNKEAKGHEQRLLDLTSLLLSLSLFLKSCLFRLSLMLFDSKMSSCTSGYAHGIGTCSSCSHHRPDSLSFFRKSGICITLLGPPPKKIMIGLSFPAVTCVVWTYEILLVSTVTVTASSKRPHVSLHPLRC